jgi:hypothetical protein
VNGEGDLTLAITAPPVSQIKGHASGRINTQNEAIGGTQCTSTYKRKRTVDSRN